MKFSIYLSLIIAALVVTGCTLTRKVENNRLEGVWQTGSPMTADGKAAGPARFIKIYHNSTFKSIALTSKGAMTFVEGTYEIVNDSLFNESITAAMNKRMEGTTNHFKYKIDGNIMHMSGTVNTGSGGTAALLETWKKVD